MRVIGAALVLLLGGTTFGESQVRNAELGYGLTLPSGFREYPEGRARKDVVDCWVEATPASQNGSVVLCVQRLGGTLGRERMRQKDAPSPGMQVVSFKWKTFEIDGVKSVTARDGIPVVVIAAQVPLQQEAIQLIVSGPQDQEARANAIMISTLSTLDGESNWLSSTERAGRLGQSVGLLIGVGVALIVIGIWPRRRRRSA